MQLVSAMSCFAGEACRRRLGVMVETGMQVLMCMALAAVASVKASDGAKGFDIPCNG